MASDRKKKKTLQSFIKRWSGEHKEKQESQKFLLELLKDVFELEEVTKRIEFEKPVETDFSTDFIDAYIPETKTIIEMKSSNIDLRNHPSGKHKNAFLQARSYYNFLPNNERGRYIICCNFKSFDIYDMNHPHDDPIRIDLENLEEDYPKLEILVDPTYLSEEKQIAQEQKELSLGAAKLVAKLYDLFLKIYDDHPSKEESNILNILVVRLVFCFFAEDAGLFEKRQFHNFLKEYSASTVNLGLTKLFEVLDTKEQDRNPKTLPSNLFAFPYVNGGLFSQRIEVPTFTPEIMQNLVEGMSDFKWAKISPTIFGAVFESTLNPETRRAGGMHYTSIENIHKVIDPLFLDDLKRELEKIKASKRKNERIDKAKEFQDKLASLKFLDPACGSGNFLTESFLCLRKLENEAIKIQMLDGNIQLLEFGIIKVKIQQFYGIEINDFAVAVAQTALYIAEAQMVQETQKLFLERHFNYLPLPLYENIHEGDALFMDWNKVVPSSVLSYIMGNPPFVGSTFQKESQKNGMKYVYVDSSNKTFPKIGKIDYVAAWFFKAAQYIQNTKIEGAFVSTNSITQGEQVEIAWNPIYSRFPSFCINFAYTSFKWENPNGLEKVGVYVVIIGFASIPRKEKYIFEENKNRKVEIINSYLIEGPIQFVKARKKPLDKVPIMISGAKPADDGNLILSPKEAEQLKQAHPELSSYIRPFLMGADFIKRKPRYCLWFNDSPPLNVLKLIKQKLVAVKEFRLKSPWKEAQRKAVYPYLFIAPREPSGNYIAFPVVSSGRREYIPLDYLDKNVIPGNKLFFIDTPSIYLFGVLTSKVHMAWIRAVAGRLKSDYSYSNTVVYNTFPWPTPTDKQKAKIEQTAQAILDARALYPEASLADLYDPLTMPIELRKAHEANDKAVMAAYGFKSSMSESQVVAELMKMYQKLVESEE